MVCLDDRREPMRPAKLWCDMESAAETSKLSSQLGWQMVPAFTASKALWLKRHEPESWARTATILLPHDYINLWLTGRVAAEPGDASGTGVLERPAAAATAAAYDRDACALVNDGFVAMLASLSSPDAVVGNVLATRRGNLGLPPDNADGRCPALSPRARVRGVRRQHVLRAGGGGGPRGTAGGVAG